MWHQPGCCRIFHHLATFGRLKKGFKPLLSGEVVAPPDLSLSRPTGLRACWAGLLVCWLTGRPAGCLAGWLAGFLVGLLPGLLAGWVASWCVCLLAICFLLAGWKLDGFTKSNLIKKNIFCLLGQTRTYWNLCSGTGCQQQ